MPLPHSQSRFPSHTKTHIEIKMWDRNQKSNAESMMTSVNAMQIFMTQDAAPPPQPPRNQGTPASSAHAEDKSNEKLPKRRKSTDSLKGPLAISDRPSILAPSVLVGINSSTGERPAGPAEQRRRGGCRGRMIQWIGVVFLPPQDGRSGSSSRPRTRRFTTC